MELASEVTSHAEFVSALVFHCTAKQGANPLISLHNITLNLIGLGQTEMLKGILEPANMDATDRQGCLPGTRLEILQDLLVSLTDPSTGHNIVWLCGPTGCGKSTILNTLADQLFKLRRCGAFMFWDRNDALNGDPRRVLVTLAYKLARFNPIFAEKLASQIDAWAGITTSSFSIQFEHLILEPLRALAGSRGAGPIVIILDGLDGCGTHKSREGLIQVLKDGLAKLPNMVRVLIASRGEPDMNSAFTRPSIVRRNIPIDDAAMDSDIFQLFRRRFVPVAASWKIMGFPSDWPGDQAVQQLVGRARGLFIWAVTTIRFIENGRPDHELDRVLDASAHGEPNNQLDKLYGLLLTRPFSSSNPSEREAVRSILGAIVVAYEQLTDEQLSKLLRLEPSVVSDILHRLRPLLHWNQGEPVRVFHPSITDFLCDPARCQDAHLYINASTYHTTLAIGCLRVLESELKFNIAGIETSHLRNKDIPGIQERIDEAISPTLVYASEYWADHLESGSGSPSLPLVLTQFMEHRVLFWIEVFSLRNRVSVASVKLMKVAHWAKVSHSLCAINKLRVIF